MPWMAISVPIDCTRSTHSLVPARSAVTVAAGGAIFATNSLIIAGLNTRLK